MEFNEFIDQSTYYEDAVRALRAARAMKIPEMDMDIPNKEIAQILAQSPGPRSYRFVHPILSKLTERNRSFSSEIIEALIEEKLHKKHKIKFEILFLHTFQFWKQRGPDECNPKKLIEILTALDLPEIAADIEKEIVPQFTEGKKTWWMNAVVQIVKHPFFTYDHDKWRSMAKYMQIENDVTQLQSVINAVNLEDFWIAALDAFEATTLLETCKVREMEIALKGCDFMEAHDRLQELRLKMEREKQEEVDQQERRNH